MKPLFRLSLLLVITIALFSSCKNSSPKQTKFIPKESAFVVTLNSKALQDKLVKSQATLENLIKSMTGNEDSVIDKGKKEWDLLKNSGIDLDENIYVSIVQKGGMSMGMGNSVHAAVAGLSDATKFEAYVKTKHAGAEIKKEKDYSYSMKDNDMVAWGKDVIIFMSYNKAPAMPQFDTTSPASFEVKPVQADVSVDDIKTEMTAYFNLKEDQSIASIPEFRDLAGQKVDASVWINSASSVEDLPIPLPKLKELIENSYTAATINFEDGKIVMNSKTYSSDAMTDILEKHSGATVNLDLVKNYPSNNIAGFFVTAFNPDFFNGIVQFLEVGGLVDGFLTKTMGTNYTLKQALKAIKGDVALVVSDVKLRGSDSTTKGNEFKNGIGNDFFNNPKLLINIPLGDKAEANKLLDKLVEQQMIVKVSNEYKLSPVMSSMGFHLSVDEKNLMVASDSLLVGQYKSGTIKSNMDQKILDEFKGKSTAGFVDLERIINSVVPNPTNAESLASAKATFKNIKGSTDNFKGKHIEGRIEVNFKDEKENSLTSLLKFMATAQNESQKHKKDSRWKDEIKVDSTAKEVE